MRLTLAAEKFAFMPVAMTFDIFTHLAIWNALDSDLMANILFRALKIGRMRVKYDHHAQIIDIIGFDRAKECPSIPRRAFR